MSTTTTCPLCQGQYYLLDASGAARACSCLAVERERRQFRQLASASSWTRQMESMRFETFLPGSDEQAKDAYVALGHWLERPRGWLCFCGGTGTGKTHLLAAAAHALQAQHRRVLYVMESQVLAYLRSGIERHEVDARLALLQHVPYLLIDEVGVEPETDFATRSLFLLLDYRYANRLPTLLASNRAPDTLPERLASRVLDESVCWTFVLTGDRRRSAARVTLHPLMSAVQS